MQAIAEFFSIVPNPMILVDAQGMIVLANEHTCALFGYQPGRLTGKPVTLLMSQRYREMHTGHLEAFLLSSDSQEMGVGMEVSACASDGTEFPVEFSLNPYGEKSEAYTLATIRAIPVGKAIETRMRHLNRVLAMQSRINALIVRVHDREELFRETCRIAVEVGTFCMAWIGMFDASKSELEVQARFGAHAEEYLGAVVSKGRMLEGSFGTAIREDRPLWIEDYHNDPLITTQDKATIRFGWNSMAILPLHRKGVPVGVLALYAGQMGTLDDEEKSYLSELAANLSFAIDHLEKEEMLEHLANCDALTGLPNRARFLKQVTHHLHAASAAGHMLAVLELDLERFKNINDSLGRLAGDAVLKQVAAWLTLEVGDSNLLARMDTDHFAIIIPKLEREGDVAVLVERWMNTLRDQSFEVGENTFRISAKVGISMYPDDGADAGTLFNHAEAALKQAKSSRNRYLFHTPKMTEMMAGKFLLENQMRRALDKQQFVLHYQPKVSATTGALMGAEALIRWNDPRTGLVPPARFIPLLEETGLIYEAGRWALGKAMEDASRWRRVGLPAVQISVNVSPLQLRDRKFMRDIEWAIGNSPGAGAALELEITEGMIMEDLEFSITTLRRIRAMGVSIAIDDFGTGFSSLSCLSKLPLDTLKIDRSFVMDLTENPDRLAQVSAIVTLAHSMNLIVVAEGVETEAQSSVLRMLGCDEMQGFLFSKPLPCEVFEASCLAMASMGSLVSQPHRSSVEREFDKLLTVERGLDGNTGDTMSNLTDQGVFCNTPRPSTSVTK
jgi:diguanylate cyclase (GGDEF)-like protein/PAS domain S-box-containing protein